MPGSAYLSERSSAMRCSATGIKRQVRMMVDEIFDFHEDFDTVLIVRPKYDSENYLNNKKSLERLKKKVKMI